MSSLTEIGANAENYIIALHTNCKELHKLE